MRSRVSQYSRKLFTRLSGKHLNLGPRLVPHLHLCLPKTQSSLISKDSRAITPPKPIPCSNTLPDAQKRPRITERRATLGPYGPLRPPCAARTYALHASRPDRLRCRLTEAELWRNHERRARPRHSDPRAALAAENLELRQQLGVLQRSVKRPRLLRRDRVFLGWLSRLWAGWRSSLIIVKPEIINVGGRRSPLPASA